jgi:hypothetical protein
MKEIYVVVNISDREFSLPEPSAKLIVKKRIHSHPGKFRAGGSSWR